jgi:LEA14-like dessication related protein
MKKALLFLGIAGAGAGIYFYYKQQIDDLMNFTYEIIGYGIDKLTLADATIRLTIRVHSTSKLSATITNLNLDVYMDDVKLGNVQEVNPIIIPAMGYSDVEVKVNFSPVQIGQNAINLIQNYAQKNDSVIRTAGYMKVKAGFVSTSVPFEYTTTIKEQMLAPTT